MTEIKNGDTVVVDLDKPASNWHKAEGVLVEKRSWSNGGKVRITKLSPNYDTLSPYAVKVGDEAQLANLTKAPGFRVGTKALFTGKVTGFEGQTVTVTETLMHGSYDYRVSRADGAVCPVHHFELQRIEEPVAPKPFKVGDWVTVKGWETKSEISTWEGRTGKVYLIDTREDPTICLKFEDGKLPASGGWEAKYLVAADPEPVEFKKGDIVKHKAGAHKYLSHREEGLTFIVDEVKGSLIHPVRVRALGQKDARGYRHDELEAGTPLSTWEIELLDNTLGATLTKVPAAAPYPVKFAMGGTITETPKAEAVDGPAHYGGKDNPYEVIKVAEAWGFNENAYLFNALKYLGRAGKKGDKVEDLKKLVFYAEREIALEQAK